MSSSEELFKCHLSDIEECPFDSTYSQWTSQLSEASKYLTNFKCEFSNHQLKCDEVQNQIHILVEKFTEYQRYVSQNLSSFSIHWLEHKSNISKILLEIDKQAIELENHSLKIQNLKSKVSESKGDEDILNEILKRRDIERDPIKKETVKLHSLRSKIIFQELPILERTRVIRDIREIFEFSEKIESLYGDETKADSISGEQNEIILETYNEVVSRLKRLMIYISPDGPGKSEQKIDLPGYSYIISILKNTQLRHLELKSKNHHFDTYIINNIFQLDLGLFLDFHSKLCND